MRTFWKVAKAMRWAAAVILVAMVPPVTFAQVDTGEIRLLVADAAGLALPSSGTLTSESSQTERAFETDPAGRFTFEHLPFGIYRLTAEHAGFAPSIMLIEVRSSIPREVRLTLSIAPLATEVQVTDAATLLDPHAAGVAYSVSAQQIREQQSSIPARNLLDLIQMQPGWLFEANAVLHPRGSEYQTLFVVDGVPMDENRSPGFAPSLENSEIEAMTVLTGNYPAEYGRKLGGVVEVVANHDIIGGFHGAAEFGGGSFGTETALLSGTYGWQHAALTLSFSGDHTNHFLDPPVTGNYTNSGSLGGFNTAYQQDLSESDRIDLSFQRNQSQFEVPNENLQEAAGQRQDRDGREDRGQASWTRVLSPQLLLSVRASVEDLSANLWSNPQSTPIIAFQQRGFRRGYFNAAIASHKGRHELKFGADAYYAPVSEALQYRITDATYFDEGTPLSFDFQDRRLDREQALFAQDRAQFGNLTLSAGLRWDHYSLVVHDNAWSPRLGAAWYWPKADLVLRFSYDRAFLTPAMENLLLASAPQVDSLNPEVLRLPVQPSRGNFLEAGFSKAFKGQMRLDVTFYRRAFDQYADDDVFLNTGISFPVAFASANIHGVDVKLEMPRWGRLSGFLSYSNMTGIAQLPVTGGLFLGDDAQGVLGVTTRFPISQDQRNTARARLRYQLHPRFWMAASAAYGSGLPVEIGPAPDIGSLIEQYGNRIINQVNFGAGRVRPNFSLDAAAGADVWKAEKKIVRLEVEAENLTNRLNLLNFAGLFSGTALAPPRNANVRLRFEF